MPANFTLYNQLDAMDCGPTCLRMICKHYGKRVSLETLRYEAQYGKDGVSMLGMSEAAEKVGLRTKGVKISFEQLVNEAPLPTVLHWDQYHFVVLVKIIRNKNFSLLHLWRRAGDEFVIADPAKGMITLSKEDFLQHWISTSNNESNLGIALLLEPTAKFYEQEDSAPVGEAGRGILAGACSTVTYSTIKNIFCNSYSAYSLAVCCN